MKNLGLVKLKQGTVGYLSYIGYYNFWYPDTEQPITIPTDIEVEHLSLWKNQGDYIAFKIPQIVFKPEDLSTEYVCVWIAADQILTS